jgi:hypothetical protein
MEPKAKSTESENTLSKLDLGIPVPFEQYSVARADEKPSESVVSGRGPMPFNDCPPSLLRWRPPYGTVPLPPREDSERVEPQKSLPITEQTYAIHSKL